MTSNISTQLQAEIANEFEIDDLKHPIKKEAAIENNENAWKVIVLAIMFVILFSAFNSVSLLMTPIYEQLGYGYFGKISTLLIYTTFALNDFLAPLQIRALKLKMGLFIGGTGYIAFMMGGLLLTSCHLKFQDEGFLCSKGVIITVGVIGSIFCGATAALIWLVQAAYVDYCSNKANKGKFFGIFGSVFNASTILGNMVGAYLLEQFDQYIFILTMGSMVVISTFSFLLVPKVDNFDSEDRNPHLKKSNIKEQLLGIKKIILMPEFRPLISYCLYCGFSLAIYSTFFYKIIEDTLGPNPSDNFKNERTEISYVAQGIISVANCYFIGKVFDLFSIMKTVNLTNFTFLFAMIFGMMAIHYSVYNFALVMVVLWAIGDTSIKTISNAIIARDFDGNLDAFAASRIITEIGVILGTLISIFVGDASPYFFIVLILVITVIMQLHMREYTVKDLHKELKE